MSAKSAPTLLTPNVLNLGVLWLVYGVLRIAAGIWIILYSGTLTVMWGALLARVPDPFSWMAFFHVALMVIVALDFIACVVSLIAAAALMRGGAAGRKWALIAAFFGLINGPLGIVLGAFTVAWLLPRDAGAAYAKIATAA